MLIAKYLIIYILTHELLLFEKGELREELMGQDKDGEILHLFPDG